MRRACCTHSRVRFDMRRWNGYHHDCTKLQLSEERKECLTVRIGRCKFFCSFWTPAMFLMGPERKTKRGYPTACSNGSHRIGSATSAVVGDGTDQGVDGDGNCKVCKKSNVIASWNLTLLLGLSWDDVTWSFTFTIIVKLQMFVWYNKIPLLLLFAYVKMTLSYTTQWWRISRLVGTKPQTWTSLGNNTCTYPIPYPISHPFSLH